MKVLKHCDGSFLEDQDFWRFSGIFRDVWLVSEVEKAPYDLIVDATLSGDFETGMLTVKDADGKVVLEKKYENPKLWSCETPNMYYETVAFGGDSYAVASASALSSWAPTATKWSPRPATPSRSRA